ncbi:sigma-70 family RNA polymerase sigma factor [Roseiconus nitratireducens]|uniref:Sigma-70 family RNA polymerase sigma factor n=1 Tax=Roseiconus nitratireducens TaxID=2605748 RepID=A0A5M6D6C4_9BACT|nr:sigma-70 family RNA polymerase sigma factor [Roseiconus nitratireducens]KAA5543087.1 sigma-70 family RNA polymerase sigma factor [Roseiconus nitratireducens]
MSQLTQSEENSSGISLALRLRDRSAGAWGELIDLYGPLVCRWCAAAGLSRAAQEDVTQDVFLAVHRSIGSFDATSRRSTFKGWLWTITRNAVLKHVERQKTVGRGGSAALADLASVPEPGPDISEETPPSDPGETAALVHRAIEQIRPHVAPRTWEAFWNTAVLGRPSSDVADDLGMSAAAVRKAKSRTLHRLRLQLGDL